MEWHDAARHGESSHSCRDSSLWYTNWAVSGHSTRRMSTIEVGTSYSYEMRLVWYRRQVILVQVKHYDIRINVKPHSFNRINWHNLKLYYLFEWTVKEWTTSLKQSQSLKWAISNETTMFAHETKLAQFTLLEENKPAWTSNRIVTSFVSTSLTWNGFISYSGVKDILCWRSLWVESNSPRLEYDEQSWQESPSLSYQVLLLESLLELCQPS